MKRCIGIDLGKKRFEAVALIDGKVESRLAGTTTENGFTNLVKWVRDTDSIGIETGSLTKYVVDFLQSHSKAKITVLDARQLPIIYQSVKKNDKEDALKIARLISRFSDEELPSVYIPSDQEQGFREILNEYTHYKHTRKDYLLRLNSLLAKNGITEVKRATLKSVSTREKYMSRLSGATLLSAKRLVKHIEMLEVSLSELENEMKEILKENKEFTTIAMSIPGVAVISAFTFLAYIGDGSRFSSAKKLSSYAGLVPKIDISGEQVRYGRIKPGCIPIKSIILQTSWGVIRSNMEGPLKEFYQRLYQKIGKKKAAVATARKLLETFYTMLKNKETYWPAEEQYVQQKLKQYALI